MEEQFKKYLDLMKELGGILEQLTETAEKKIDAVRRDDLQGLDQCIRQEQALSLFVRNIEAKRDGMIGELGLSGVTLSDMPGYVPESLRSEARATAETLRGQYLIYAGASESARTMLEVTLHQIEKMFREEEPDASELPASVKADIRA